MRPTRCTTGDNTPEGRCNVTYFVGRIVFLFIVRVFTVFNRRHLKNTHDILKSVVCRSTFGLIDELMEFIILALTVFNCSHVKNTRNIPKSVVCRSRLGLISRLMEFRNTFLSFRWSTLVKYYDLRLLKGHHYHKYFVPIVFPFIFLITNRMVI